MALVLHGHKICQQTQGVIALTYICSNNYATSVQKVRLSDIKRGTGGRSSFSGIVATVFGSTGFMGRYVCNKLGKIGSQLILPYRGDHYEALKLKLSGDLGQVLFQPYYLRDEESIRKAVKYSNVVINLVGRDWETKNFKFNDVHVEGAARIARIAKEEGVEKLIHFSALNATERPTPIVTKKGSGFLASKWAGEQAVLKEFPNATIFRPADIYGQEDRFLRMYIHIWRHQGKWMPLWKKGEETIKQPVHCADVAQAVVNAIRDPESSGKIYQAVGPKRYQLSELVDWFHRVIRKDQHGYYRYDLRYDPLFKIRVSISELISPSFPIGNLHWERLEREFVTDNVDKGICTLEDLGVNLTHMENQVPWELKPWRLGAYHEKEAAVEFDLPAPPPSIA